jgi:UDP-glucose 4-epimerase
MRALVTGCAGFIGSNLSESLLARGHSVVGIDSLTDTYAREAKLHNVGKAAEQKHFRLLTHDLASEDLTSHLRGRDVVFHLAAEPGVRNSWGRRFQAYVRNNVVATQNLLEGVVRTGVPRLVFASSSSVYGASAQLPVEENGTLSPISPYGVTKLAAEQLCRAYAESSGIEVVSLRYFSIYGPKQRPDMAFHRFLRAAIENDEIVLYGDGGQTRDFTYVDDVVAATVAAAERDGLAGEVLNIAGGASVSLAGALGVIEELAGLKLRVTRRAPQAGDVRDTWADTSRAQEKLGFQAATALEDGLKRQLDWMRSSQRAASKA